MNTNLLTMDNMLFAGVILTPAPVAKSNPFPNSSQFSISENPAKSPSNTNELKTTDNISDTAHDESINKTGQDFDQTLLKAVKNQSTQQSQANNNNKDKNQVTKNQNEQNPASEASPKTEPAQSESAQQIPFTLEILVKESTAKVEPKTSSQVAQLIANLKDGKLHKDGKSPLVIEQAVKPTVNKLPLTVDKKLLIPNSSDTVITNSPKDQSKLEAALLNIPKNTPSTDKQPKKIQSNDAELKETIIKAKNPDNSQNTKKPASDALADDNSNKPVKNEKLSILNANIAIDNTKSSKLSSKQLETDTLKVDGSKTAKENSISADKPVIETKEKTPALNNISISETQNQNKIIEKDTQSKIIAPEKPTQNPNNTSVISDNKTTKTEILSESSTNKSNETPNTKNKPSDSGTVSDDSITKELNILDVHVSTGQTKNNNSSAFSNANSELEKILTQNNPQAAVTEQPSGSAENTKPLDMPIQTSPGNQTINVGKQVFESIQSSFSKEQRNQQITIQLNPPELGKVSIKFQEQNNQIIGLLEVSKTQTRVEVEQAIPEIVRNLQDSGIQIKRLDVVLSHEQEGKSGQEALQDHTMRNNHNQQQGSADSYTGSNNPDAHEINEWLINNHNKYRNTSGLHNSLTANDSINMLA